MIQTSVLECEETTEHCPWCSKMLPAALLETAHPGASHETTFACPHCDKPIIMRMKLAYPMRRSETSEERWARIKQKLDDEDFDEEYD